MCVEGESGESNIPAFVCIVLYGIGDLKVLRSVL